MTIKVGDWAIRADSYRPEVGLIEKVTEKTVLFKADYWRAVRVQKESIIAYGSDKSLLEKAVERMISASSECNRRRSEAKIWERKQHTQICAEVMLRLEERNPQ